ncbi:MAG: hypothetical protein AAFX99_14925, partial [Myxococcota bacterium]
MALCHGSLLIKKLSRSQTACTTPPYIMTSEEQTQLLKLLLTISPGTATWEMLCALFEGCSPDLPDPQALAATQDRLASWDDAIRDISLRQWWPSFPARSPKAFWTHLARSLTVYSLDTKAHLQPLCTNPRLAC